MNFTLVAAVALTASILGFPMTVGLGKVESKIDGILSIPLGVLLIFSIVCCIIIGGVVATLSAVVATIQIAGNPFLPLVGGAAFAFVAYTLTLAYTYNRDGGMLPTTMVAYFGTLAMISGALTAVVNLIWLPFFIYGSLVG